MQDKYATTPLKHPNTLLKGNTYIFYTKKRIKLTNHSIDKLLETFGLADE